MARITKEMLQMLAHDIMLDLQDEELTNLSQEFDVILKQMDLVQKINTTNVHSMHFPFDLTVDYLREDDEIDVAPQAEILAAAPKKIDDYIVINKVVK
ncbi:Asp-tRNA(Asn)/Glu-tRNA(Gln) amidotransferase GatCAB subunit C [Spiroplasma sp. ChiS]|uniref:Asp-tRNA(Asn)/Glu-tRNA(Gln) amidotransferase subunit GatC n=1 Tax=Spiroplasma sp. ChiS TaxID=2099885 RepID=UPI000CF962BC|nr:Asp-tRNA(Asn)/Glu-tRNA(Gln) amidotransferase subunit GatC [Spiroplasma sp. ChiS]PQP77962.1 Asp-tRNA(Asn)/Glu-tRNA(Gln) amidotransferase GatCAB subunit C [Spiroplasma sp. ChiS]